MDVDFTTQWKGGDLKMICEGPEEEEETPAKKTKRNNILYASKIIMEMWSPVFVAMLKEDAFQEGAKQEVTLPGKKYDAVLELLRVLHPPCKPVTVNNAYHVLPMAHEFQITQVVRSCDAAMSKDEPSLKNLVLADMYELPQTRKVCIDAEVLRRCTMIELSNNPFFRLLSDKCKFEFLQARQMNLDKNYYILEKSATHRKRNIKSGRIEYHN